MKSTTIQNITLPANHSSLGLFFADHSFGSGSDDHTGFRFTAKEILSLEAYFNVFYERLFAELTGLHEISLELRLEGSFKIKIFRASSANNVTLLHQSAFKGHGSAPFLHRIDLVSTPRLSGYLYATIEPLEAGGILHSGRWLTHAKPRNDVHLSIVLTTFRRAEFARRIIAGVQASSHLREEKLEFVIVDNSSSLTLADLGADPHHPSGSHPITLIHQANLGGAGGFGRGALEALSGRTRIDATHLLFMDDDVVVEPETIFRTIQLLRFTKTKVVLGAPMFDLYRPNDVTVLSEHIDSSRHALYPSLINGCFEPIGTSALLRVADTPETAWTCWWYSVFPLEAFRNHGLPLPCFIHGDDVEFGHRLKKNGYRLHYYPGWGVWHEPFYSKIATWMEYYNMRNALICRGLHLSDIEISSLIQTVFQKEVARALDTFNYGAAQAMICGIEHFLEGPSVVAENHPVSLHVRAQRAYEEFAPKPWRTDWPNNPPRKPPRRFPFRRKALRKLLYNGHCFPWLQRNDSMRPDLVMTHGDHHPCATTFADSIALHEVWTGHTKVYDRSNRTYWRLRRRAMGLRSRLTKEFHAASRAWQQAQPRITSLEFWETYVKKTHTETQQ